MSDGLLCCASCGVTVSRAIAAVSGWRPPPVTADEHESRVAGDVMCAWCALVAHTRRGEPVPAAVMRRSAARAARTTMTG